MGKAEQTRQMIIEKAAPIFNRKGYLGTSLSDLTGSTGLTKGAIYGNFKNKNDIALAAFDYNINKIVTALMSDLSVVDDPVDKLLSVADFFIKNSGEIYKKGGCPLANAAADSDDTNTLLNKKVKSSIEGLKKLIIHIIDEGQAEKKIIPSVKSDSFSSVMISMIEGGTLLSKTSGDMAYLNNSIQQLKSLIIDIKQE